jgi:hypothetical protein
MAAEAVLTFGDTAAGAGLTAAACGVDGNVIGAVAAAG